MSIASSAFDVHPGPQLEIRIRNIDAHFGGAFRFVDEWIDQGDRAVEVLARIRLGGDGDLLPDLKHRQFVFIKFRPHPDEAEIGDFHQHVAHFDALALFDGHGLHDAAKGREQCERIGGFACFFQLCDLLFSYVPELQPTLR